MEANKSKKSKLTIVAIILSSIAIVLALAIIAGVILKPVIDFVGSIISFVVVIGVLVVGGIIILSNSGMYFGSEPYLTSDIYGGCQINYSLNLFDSEIVVPETINDMQVVSIGASAFEANENVTKIVLPNGLKNIEENAFAYCTSLEEIVIPDTVEYIGDNAFLGCSSLKSIEIGASTRFIGVGAFQDCVSLETVTLKNGLEEIGMQAFYGCTSLRAIEIPKNVFKIGMGAFYGCESMTFAMIYGLYKVGDTTVSVGDFPNAQEMAYALTNTYSQYDWEK